ncbi:MAG: caspase family protein [Chlamydiales bacterium]|nr:caspase family protein [Chlamydiales bacterium]
MLRLVQYFIVGVFLFFHSGGHAATLHAILVGDVEDPSIGVAVRNDIALMHQRVQDIARLADMSLAETVLTEKDYTYAKVTKELARLTVASDDVIIYYHSSHGFRTSNMSEPWPALYFGDNDKSIRLQSLIDIIRSKKPAFSVVLADACNSFVTYAWGYPNAPFYSNFPSESEQKKGYRRLFRETRGCFIASSSGPGQSSYSLNGVGAIFTGCFLQGLDSALIKGQADWSKVVAATSQFTKQYVTRYGLDQTPKFQIK